MNCLRRTLSSNVGPLFFILVLGGSVALSPSVVASAQDAVSEEDAERARELFLEARADFESGQLASARQLLEESLELAPRPGTANNLARVLSQMGQSLAAETLLERVLANEFGEVDGSQEATTRQLLTAIGSDIAVALFVVAPGTEASLEVDGARVARFTDGGEHEERLDAGEHRVSLIGASDRRAESDLSLGPGEQRTLRLALPAGSGGGTGGLHTGGPNGELEDSDGVASSPWFWIALTGGAALVAGAVLFFVLSSEQGADADPVWGSAEALRF